MWFQEFVKLLRIISFMEEGIYHSLKKESDILTLLNLIPQLCHAKIIIICFLKNSIELIIWTEKWIWTTPKHLSNVNRFINSPMEFHSFCQGESYCPLFSLMYHPSRKVVGCCNNNSKKSFFAWIFVSYCYFYLNIMVKYLLDIEVPVTDYLPINFFDWLFWY